MIKKIVRKILIKLSLDDFLWNYVYSGNHLIFCISTGRSGTNYLSELLSTGKDVDAHHEVQPMMTGVYIDMINNKPLKSSYGARKYKSKFLKKYIKNIPRKKTYIEMSHMFIKTFYDVVMDSFKNVRIIILKRDIIDTIKSFYELNYFSNDSYAWRDWMMSPNAVTSTMKTIGEDESMTQIELIISYLMDMEIRTQKFKKKYKNTKIIEANIEELNSKIGVIKLFEELNILTTDRTFQLLGKKINSRVIMKNNNNNKISTNMVKHELNNFVVKAKKNGLELPVCFASYLYE